LFPGRGIPGVEVVGAALAAGAAGADLVAGAAGAEAEDSASGAVGAAEVAGLVALVSFGAGAATSAGASSVVAIDSASALAAAFLAGAFLGASSFGLASGNASLSFFATGGAIVDDPLFTNSPSSASLAKATLESIPSSLAMSYTRGSATYFSCLGPTPKTGQAVKAVGYSFRVTHFLPTSFLPVL
jgi:hypothetical protein